MSTYVLPDLPYDYAALEPFISRKTMELHHDKHHAAYVNGANAALDALKEARAMHDMTRIHQLARNLAFNAAGHVNHTIFWRNLSPAGGGAPTGELARALEEEFGSLDTFKEQFTSVATSLQGSGWAALVYEPLADRLVTLRLHDHQMGLPAHTMPLLMLDMWEHAFYLDYLNDKFAYVKAFWEVVNWRDVADRLVSARSMREKHV